MKLAETRLKQEDGNKKLSGSVKYTAFKAGIFEIYRANSIMYYDRNKLLAAVKDQGKTHHLRYSASVSC